MAKRSRKRRKQRRRNPSPQGGPSHAASRPASASEDDAAGVAARRRRGAAQGPPPAPWGSFPLSEITIFIAIVLFVGGFFVPPPRGAVMLGAGLVLGSLAGLELAIREHLAGYKSHTTLLAGALGVAVIAAGYVLAPEGFPAVGAVAIGAGVFALAAYLLAGVFRRRSGGVLFKVKG